MSEKRIMTDDEVDAIIHAGELSADFEDEIFEDDDDLIFRSIELDPERDPFGWDITDRIDWESQDYEFEYD